MEFERMSMARLDEIQRLLGQKRSIQEIATTLHCRKQTVIDVKKNLLTPKMLLEAQQKGQTRLPPSWSLNVDWDAIQKEIGKGFEVKRIWEEYSASNTSYSNFFKYVRKRFSSLLEKTVTLREFSPGEYSEVDYAGDTIDWMDSDGEIHESQVFIGILCYSQLIFADATENQRKENWLLSHRKMFEEFRGSSKVVVPDNLKSAVTCTHLYDPDLNPDYTELAKHYGIAIVPARSRRPKDKALVEGAVKLVIRLFKWTYRRHTFMSLEEINRALKTTAATINQKRHSRFGCSRIERFEKDEKPHMQSLPLEPWEGSVWKLCVLHPDCTVAMERNYYSAPYTLRGKTLRVKMTPARIEIFYDLERVALHQRIGLGKVGRRVLDLNHLPPNSRAYLEVTPQNLLSQSKFIHPKLHELIEILFEKDVLGNLRRAQGLIRKAHSTIQLHSHTVASVWIVQAAEHMIRFGSIRVKLFEDLIKAEQKKLKPQEDRTIVRKPGNPMLRRVGGIMGIVTTSDSQPINQE
jgi:transposase